MKDKELIRIVDDDSAHCDALAFLLDNEGYNVKTYQSAADFLREDDLDIPGCLVLDYQMPDINGVELQEILEVRKFAYPIIFLTAHADLDMAIKIFKKGANDLLKKPVDATVFLKAVGEALAKSRKVSGFQSGEIVQSQAKYDSLTNREREVIKLVSIGLMNCQIASRLDLSERTIETHRANAYRKLGISNLAQLRKFLSILKSSNKD